MSIDYSSIETLANSLLEKYGLRTVHGDGWKFIWNNRKASVGLCDYNSRTIQISKPIFKFLSEAEIRDTILHEIAHAITPGDGHGTLWKQCCIKIGANPKRLASIDKKTLEKIRDSFKYYIIFLNEKNELEKVGARNRVGISLFGALLPSRPETQGKLYYIESKHYGLPNAHQYLFKCKESDLEDYE